MRPLRIVAYVAAGLIGLIVIGLVLVIVFVDPNDYRDDIQRIVKEKTGLYRYPEPKILSGSNYADVGFEMVEKVRSLLEVTGPAKVNLTGGRHARRKAGELFIEA